MNAIKLFDLKLSFLMPISCTDKSKTGYTVWADPMIGTGGHGHTFSGVTVPSGMVQFNPDTHWEECDRFTFPESDKQPSFWTSRAATM